jgi:hypothetical protein
VWVRVPPKSQFGYVDNFSYLCGMEDYSHYKEEIHWVALYKANEKIECIVTTFYSKGSLVQYATSILTTPVKLSVGDSIIVKNTGHRAKVKEVVEYNEEFDYKLPAVCYHIEPPDPNSGPWYFRRNLF